jgi:hypothetical protein
MAVTTYEGIVEKGKIRLKAGVKLPENATVYIIVPDLKTDEKKKVVQVLSPHLVRREDAARFKMKVTQEKPNARVRR